MSFINKLAKVTLSFFMTNVKPPWCLTFLSYDRIYLFVLVLLVAVWWCFFLLKGIHRHRGRINIIIIIPNHVRAKESNWVWSGRAFDFSIEFTYYFSAFKYWSLWKNFIHGIDIGPFVIFRFFSLMFVMPINSWGKVVWRMKTLSSSCMMI